MSETMKVMAQCQRCGRGFITIGEDVTRDGYGFPKKPYGECNGPIRLLIEPVSINNFRNYGPLLPSRSLPND